MGKIRTCIKLGVSSALLALILLGNSNVSYAEEVLNIHGWIQEENGWSYYDENGHRCLGWIELDGKLRYITEQGAVINQLLSINGREYYFDWDGEVQRHKWVLFGDAWYYFGDDGARCLGWVEIDGKIRYIADMGAVINQFISLDGKWYYFDKDGESQRNKWLCFDDTWCWFDETGARCFGWTEIDGKIRYIADKGAIINQFICLDGKWYYFDENGESQRNKWLSFDDTWCWFDNTGARCFGWTEIDGKIRYITDKGAVINQFLYLDGKWYYFNEDGESQRNKWLSFDDTWCWFDENGARCFGWTEIDGLTYYINEKGAVKNGSVYDNGKKYYLDMNGQKAINGWYYLNGYKYYFDETGALIQNVDSIIGRQSRYYIKVNTYTNTVTVFAKDPMTGEFSIPVKNMICSCGLNSTPTVKGTFTVRRLNYWGELIGPVWGQYVSQIYGSYLFHSAWYYVNGNNRTLSVSEYRKLGNNASHGCVRMTVADAKWIFDNCNGSTVTVYNNPYQETLLDKPVRPNPVVIRGDYGYDPTDPAFR